MNIRTITTVAAFAAACLAGSTAYAGTKVKPAKKLIEPAQESCITGDIGFDVVSNYISKGIVYNNQGFIMQPYADLHFRIYKGAGALSSVTADIGIWNSFHGHHTTVGSLFNQPRSSTANWFEFDFYAGLTENVGKFSISEYFKTYESPSDMFRNAYTIGFNVAYDDSALLGAFALHPYVLAELQLEGSTGNSNNGSRGQYYEVGIAPAHSWGDLTLSLPLKGGFGSGGFYRGNRGFGYISVGVGASYALNFVPACLGKWSLSSSFTYYRLGGNNGSNGGIRSGAAGDGAAQRVVDKNQLVFQGGLKVAF